MTKELKAKVLLLDIEILPRSLGDSYVTMSADKSTVCSFGYKWYGEGDAKVISIGDDPKRFARDPYDERHLVGKISKIIQEADMVIAHFGTKFDFPYLEAKFAMYDLPGFRAIKKLDTWRMSKIFKLSSHRLANLAYMFGLDGKDKMSYEDWFAVIRSDAKVMAKMDKYCAQDVRVLEGVLKKLLPRLPVSHPFVIQVDKKDRKSHCVSCGSSKLVKNGRRFNTTSVTQRYVCLECGGSQSGEKINGSK